MSDAGDRRKNRRDDFLLWLKRQQPQSPEACRLYLQLWTGLRLQTIKTYIKEWHQIGLIRTTKSGNFELTQVSQSYLKRMEQAI